MLTQYVIMRDDLEVALESVDSNFTMNNSINFNHKVEKMKRMLRRIKIPTKMMQTESHSLAKGRDNLDMLLHDTEENKNNRDHELYNCKLKDTCV